MSFGSSSSYQGFPSAFAGGPSRLEGGQDAVNFARVDAVGASIMATVRRILDTAARNGIDNFEERTQVAIRAASLGEYAGRRRAYSHNHPGKAQLAPRYHCIAHAGYSFYQRCFFRHFHDVHVHRHGIARQHRHQESHVVYGGQRHEFFLVHPFAGGAAKQYGSALPDGFNDKSSRHDGIIGEVSQELNLVACDVFNGFDVFPRFQLQHAVHHKHRKTLLQMFFYFLEGHDHKYSFESLV